MKVMCNGFNLYHQLNNSEPILQTLKLCFDEVEIRNYCINHSFSIVQANDHWFKTYPYKQIGKVEVKLVKLVSNDERILVLDENGKLYKVDIDSSSDFKEIPHFLISANVDDDEIIKDISVGTKITVAYTNRGRIYNIPNRLSYENRYISDIKCGKEHCLLLDQQGNVYSFGKGSRGQLGHGIIEDEEEPQLIQALAGLKIIRISAGGWHSCAISEDGDLYAWGWNGNGQLGINKESNLEKSVPVMAVPNIVDFPDPERTVMMVSCGNRHTVVLLDDNQLFGTGWNKYKQLKNEERENFHNFTHLHNFEKEEILDIKCGPWNTAVLCK